jgi:predicted peroxiredoxin
MKEIVAALSIVGIACLAGSAALSAQPEWSIAESKSSTDDTPQVSAALVVGDAARDLGDDSVTIRFRIDANEPLKEVWKSSVNGHAAFAPKPEDFIRALPDNGRVFVRALLPGGQTKDTNFILSGISEVRGKIGHACNSPGMSDESTGSISLSQRK